MKILRLLFKILIGIVILLVVLLGIIYLLKDTIIEKTVDHIEEGYNIDVDYSDISLSFFRSFPDLGLDVDDIRIKNKGDSITWADIHEVNIDLDIMTVIKPQGAMKINGVHLDKAIILYEIYEDSTSNLDAFLTSSDTSSTSDSELKIDLNSYSITSGNVIYLDHSTGTNINLAGLNHRGSGNLGATEFKLSTETSLDSFSAIINGVDYASNLKVSADADILANTETNEYSFDDVILKINEFASSLSGMVRMEDEYIAMDIDISQANSGIAELMSLIPSSFKGDYKELDADGNLSMSGKIEGQYKYGKDYYPAINMNLQVDNGMIQYPDLPEKLSALNLKMNLTKKEGSLNNIVVDVNPFSVNIGNVSHLKGHINARDLMNNLHAVGMLNGDLDLNSIAQSYPIPSVNSLSGETKFDLQFDAKMNDIQEESYENVDFNGNAELRSVKVDYKGYPLTTISSADAVLSQEELNISNLDMMFGRSDLTGSATIFKPLNFLTDDKKLKITLDGKSKFIDLGEFTAESSETTQASGSNSATSSDFAIIDRLDTDVKFQIDELNYPPYKINNVNIDSRLENGSLDLDRTQFVYEKSQFKVDGNVSQISKYLGETGPLNGKLNISSDEFNLFKFMEKSAIEETQNSSATVEDFVLPEMLNVDINTQIKKVLYDNIVMDNLNAKLSISEDQKVFINQSSASIMGGEMSLDGLFEAQNERKPFYDFNYQLTRINIPKAVRDIELVGKLAPVTEYMQGFFNTSLKLSGNLTKELGIDLNSLNLKGVFETIDAVVANFEPLNKIGDKLNVKSLKQVKIQNSKNWLEVTNGDVVVRPFDMKLGEIDATVSGTHRLTGDQLNYTLETIIPREWLKQSEITQSVDKGISWLESEAGKRGLNLDAGNQFYVDIIVTGSFKSPNVNLKLKDVTGKSVADAAKDKLKEKRKEAEDSIRNSINREKEILKEKAQARADSIKQAAAEEAKRRARDILTGGSQDSESETKKEIDKAAEEAKKKLEEARKRLKKLNPFGD